MVQEEAVEPVDQTVQQVRQQAVAVAVQQIQGEAITHQHYFQQCFSAEAEGEGREETVV